jgi:DNA-binding MarR family transcriptional regulator
MTVTQAPTVRFGELLASAQRVSAVTFNQLLKDAETPFEEWVAMTLLSRMGGSAPKVDLAADIADRIGTDQAAITAVLDRMVDKRLLAGHDANGSLLVEFTAEGAEFYRLLGERVDELSAFELSTSTSEDIAAARLVLDRFIEQAMILAAQGSAALK